MPDPDAPASEADLLSGLPANDVPAEVLLRQTPDRQRAYDLALVLQTESLRHRLEPPGADMQWRVWIRTEEADEGHALLTAFERENQPAVRGPEPFSHATGNVGLWFVVLCVIGQLATGPRDPAVLWFAKGSADASRILAGEWWRCVTALTLHADLAHALGNAASGWLLLETVARRIGPGRAAFAALLAGVLGNALTAVTVRHAFESIGASTAVFGVLGVATALQAFLRTRRGWLVVGAGLALLGTLGTGEHADLFGHLYGFGWGCLLGVLLVHVARKQEPESTLGLFVRAGLSLAALGVAWTLALR